MLNASPQAPHGGGGSGGSAPCCGMSGCPSLWHWRRPLTTALNEVSGAICTKPQGGQRTASAEATNDALRSQTTSVAGDTEFFSLFEEELGGTRPDRLLEVRPQGRVQRHTVEQIVDSPQVVPSLDVPVPQRENQLVEACRHLDLPIPEQAIEVPKISSTPRPPRRRRVRFAEHTVEQLVEVPTIISYSWLCGIMEQNVDIPVPHDRGGRDGVRSLQGFPGQSSTAYFGADSPAATAEQNVVIPVPRGDRTLHSA